MSETATIKLPDDDVVYLNKLITASDALDKRISLLSIEKHKLCEQSIAVQQQYNVFKDELFNRYPQIRGKNATINVDQGRIELEGEPEEVKTGAQTTEPVGEPVAKMEDTK